MPSDQPGLLYQIHAALAYSDPLIWRRLEIPGNATLEDLHWALQAAFGWTNSHLHQFALPPARKGDPPTLFSNPRFGLDDAGPKPQDETATRIAAILPQPDMNLAYEYDFGDSWEVILHVEAIRNLDPQVQYPQVTAGEQHSPLDDSGGIEGWYHILEVIDNPKDQEYADMRRWLGLQTGQRFDPALCDLAAINRQLHPARKRPAAEAVPPVKALKPSPDAPTFEIPADRDPKTYHFVSYDIVYDAMPNDPTEWPEQVKDQADELHRLLQTNPRKAIPRLEALLQSYPNARRIMNFLMLAYERSGNSKKAMELVEESYRRFPDYLFSKINYANLLLSQRKTPEAAAIFGSQYDLSQITGGRTRFHISEILAFYLAVGWLLAQQGNRDAAESYLAMMEKLEPEAPQTEMLASRIDTEVLVATVKKLAPGPRRAKRRRKP